MKRIRPRIAIASVVVLAATTIGGWSAAAAQVPTGAAELHRGHQDKTVTIYLTRHGQTILNTLERVQGWIDSPLMVGTSADGSVLDARILPQTVGKNLRAREGKIDAAYSADMKRHFETATYILKGANQRLKVTQDAGLREINFGKYEGAENKEMWTAIVEHMGYTVDHDADATAPVDATGQNGGWQTMQLLAITEQGLKAMMSAMKEIAEEPSEDTSIAFPAEDCTDVSDRMMDSLNSIARKAVRDNDKRVLVVSSGLSITCAIDSLGTTVTSGISNVAVSELQYKNGQWTVKSVGDTSYRQ
ncbi:MAG: histidine phosphatase family protein [Microbacterium sp.]|uniref:histidine phosphatase family protein n=1 Tax=Microbacterium sp. TaxID=51671 RepID=UPI0039E6FA5D